MICWSPHLRVGGWHRWGAGKKKSSRRRGGLTRLREEVSTCEYEDVHVLWELLTESGGRGGPLRVAAPRRTRRRDGSQVWEWAGLSFCRRF
ncbi:hypothetical protein C4D60_Mb07t01240 [Musa balbisiana]|uniref:Uncharacterized protein n=1 Tax=Musa balbisiana TaxID=52838 RepID=A0A4S8JC99_MUSBA|nr:hypothetical protein C4D60_Mb07t01240 [Musa balbisiana]